VEVIDAVKSFTKPKWVSEVFWTPEDVASFLSSLTPDQAIKAKVAMVEVKIMVIYPSN